MRRRLLTAVIAAAAFGSPLLWSLSTPILFRVEEPFDLDSSRPLTAVQIPELTYLRTRSGQSTYRLRLTAPELSKLLQQPEIWLRVANYEKTRKIVAATLISPAGNCGYEAGGGQAFPNNDTLLLIRRDACAPVPPAAERDLILTVELDEPGPIALWAGERAPTRESGLEILVADRIEGPLTGRAISGSAGYTDKLKSRTRLALLNYVWQISPSFSWLIALIALATSLVAASGWLLADRRVLAGDAGAAARASAAIGGAFLALAFALVYACTIPPFQAADEPHHFVALAALLGRPELGVEGTHLGQVGYIDQIRFHPERHFNPSDVGRLGAILTSGVAPQADVRGTGVFAVWSLFAPVLRGHGPAVTLLLARVLNAIVFAGAIGCCVFLAAAFSPSRWPLLDAFALFIIPTLPFFGMQVSNYAPLCAAYAVIGAGISVFLWDGPRAWTAGPLLGAAWAAAILLSRSALPLAPLLVSCGLARLAIRRRNPAATVIGFWLGLSLPCAIALALLPGPLRNLVEQALGLHAGSQGQVAVGALPVILGGATVGAAVVELRWKASDGQRTGADRFFSWVGWTAATLVLLTMAGSMFMAYPIAPPPDAAHVAAPLRYVGGMLLAGLTMFRLGHPDFMTSTSFWGGFGWLDTVLPASAVTALAAGSGLALSATFAWIACARRWRSGAIFCLLMLGLISAFALSAFSVIRTTPAALHGRYLLGVYIGLLTLCWHFLPRTSTAMRPRARAIVLATCGLAAVTVHAWAAVTILQRYFA